MWISKQKFQQLSDRLDTLEYQLKQVNRVHECDGRLYQTSSHGVTTIDALNALAAHVGLRWKTEWERPATIGVEKAPK
jgi:hypothetical protein